MPLEYLKLLFSRKNLTIFLSMVGVWILIITPHILIPEIQKNNSVALEYTPNNMNHIWARFDDICKLNQSFNLIKNGVISDHLTEPQPTGSLNPGILQELVPITIYAIVTYLFSSNTAPYFALGGFVSLALLMFLIIGRHLEFSWPISLTAGLISIFGYQYFLPDSIFQWLFSWNLVHTKVSGTAEEYNSFYRIFALGGTYFIFLFFIFIFHRLFSGRRNYIDAVVAGVVLGLQFYTYIYYAIAASILTGVFLIYFLIKLWVDKQNLDYKKYVSLILICALVGLIISLPSILNVLHAVSGSNNEFIRKMDGGAFKTEFFWANKEVILFGIITVFLCKKIKFRLIVLSAIFSIILTENAQLFFGFNIQQGHMYVRTAMPLLVFMFFIALYNFLSIIFNSLNYRVTFYILISVYTGFFLFESVHYAISYSNNTAKFQGVSADQKNLIKFFNIAPEAHPIIATLSPELAVNLSIESKVRLYNRFAMNAPLEPASNIFKRLALTFFLFESGKGDVREYFSISGSETEKRYDFYYFQYYFRGMEHNAMLNIILDNIYLKDNIFMYNNCKYIGKEFDYIILVNDNTKSGSFNRLRENGKCFKNVGIFGIYTVYKIDI